MIPPPLVFPGTGHRLGQRLRRWQRRRRLDSNPLTYADEAGILPLCYRPVNSTLSVQNFAFLNEKRIWHRHHWHVRLCSAFLVSTAWPWSHQTHIFKGEKTHCKTALTNRTCKWIFRLKLNWKKSNVSIVLFVSFWTQWNHDTQHNDTQHTNKKATHSIPIKTRHSAYQ